MSTLTYSRSELAGVATSTGATAKPERKSFWHRLFDSMVESRQRRADREIAAFLESRGGTITDSTEREIMDRIAGRRRTV